MNGKLWAVAFAVACFNLVVLPFGLPQFGTIGFLILINCVQVFLYLAFVWRSGKTRLVLAGTMSLAAVLASLLALFRVSEISVAIAGWSSLVLSTLSLYLYSARKGNFGELVEFVSIPVLILVGFVRAGFYLLAVGVPKLIMAIGSMGREKRTVGFRLSSGTMLKGSLISFPILVVLMVLVLMVSESFYGLLQSYFVALPFEFPLIDLVVRQRISFSILLALVLLPVVFIRTKVNTFGRLRKDFYQAFYVEAILLVGAMALIIAVYLILRFDYVFGIVPGQDLSSFGLVDFDDYVRRGFVELGLMALGVFGLTTWSLLVLRSKVRKDNWLELVNIVLLAEVVGFVLTLIRRMLLGVLDSGTTRFEVYGLIGLAVFLVFSGFLLSRFVLKRFTGWYVAEFGLVVVFVFVASLLNVDKIVASGLPPKNGVEVDRVYVAGLSADAVDGWVEAFEHSRKTVENFRVLGRSEWNVAEQRELVEAQRVLSLLRRQYWGMARMYGTHGQQQVLSYVGFAREKNSEVDMAARVYEANVAAWSAYERLELAVDAHELVRLEELAVSLSSVVEQNKVKVR